MAALTQLWSMRSPLDLVGTSIHMTEAMWNNRLGGTGAGIDSFYEYLLKAYILFGKSDTASVDFTCCPAISSTKFLECVQLLIPLTSTPPC